MSSSLKMARLDYFTFKSQFVSHAVLVLMIIMFSIMGFSFITLGITVAWFVALLSMNIFAVQEKNEMEQLYISLPFSLENIICGRYIFIFANYIFAVIFSIVIEVLVSFFQNKNVNYADILFGTCISLSMFTIITSIQIPIYFKVGYTKAKVWGMIPFVSVMAICVLPFFIDTYTIIMAGMIKHRTILEIIILALSFVFLLVS